MTTLATKFPDKRIFTLADLPALEADRSSLPPQPSNGQLKRIVTLGNLPSQPQGTQGGADAVHEALVSTREARAVVREASASVERLSGDLDNLTNNIRATFDRVERDMQEFRRRTEQSATIMGAIQAQIGAIAREQREIAEEMDNRSWNVRCVVITALVLAIFLLLSAYFG